MVYVILNNADARALGLTENEWHAIRHNETNLRCFAEGLFIGRSPFESMSVALDRNRGSDRFHNKMIACDLGFERVEQVLRIEDKDGRVD